MPAATPSAVTGTPPPAPQDPTGVRTPEGKPLTPITLEVSKLPKITAPLKISAENPRYFRAGDKPVFLAGLHTWNNLIDMGATENPAPLDFKRYLDLMESLGHNFTRMWAWDMAGKWNHGGAGFVQQFPWQRTGPGLAPDGRPKFDLTKHDESYFKRLRERVSAASHDRGIYVSIMLFDSWSQFSRKSIDINRHLFAEPTNINGIDIRKSLVHGSHDGWLGLDDERVLAIQEAYVKKVIETVNDLPNVLYEISNEAGERSHAWQEHLTKFIHRIETGMKYQHPVGQTGGMQTDNAKLFAGTADFVAPDLWNFGAQSEGYLHGHYTWGTAPGEKTDRPIVIDTDHLWGIGGDEVWAWKTALRGYQLWYMDPYSDDPAVIGDFPWGKDPGHQRVRREMGVIRHYISRMDLSKAKPASTLTSNGYCLAVPDQQLLIYDPAGGPFTVELGPGRWSIEWHNPFTGETFTGDSKLVRNQGTWVIRPPFKGAAVAFLERRDQ